MQHKHAIVLVKSQYETKTNQTMPVLFTYTGSHNREHTQDISSRLTC